MIFDEGTVTCSARGQRAAPACSDDIFSPGDVVAGRFRVRRLRGRGGTGQVFEAEDLELGHVVALKALRAGPDGAGSVTDLARHETRLARKISHPCVCRVHDIFSHQRSEGGGGEPVDVLAMEWLDGPTLKEHLEQHGPLVGAEASRLARQICAGLEAVHTAGILHLDLKGSNIVLVASDSGARRAVLTDFGLARLWSGTPAGVWPSGCTPAYAAPEVLREGTVSTAADLYALGVVLYESLTASLPFGDRSRDGAGEPSAAQLRSVLTSLPSPGPEWSEVILRCLSPRPEDRWATVHEVLERLEGTSERIVVPHRRTAVRVLGLLPREGVEEWTSAALTEALHGELAREEGLRGLAWQEDSRLVAEILRSGSQLRESLHERLRMRHSEADFLVAGECRLEASPAGSRLGAELAVVGVGHGDLRFRFHRSSPNADLSGLGCDLGRALRAALGSEVETHEGAPGFALPSRPQAIRAYAKGLQALQRFDLGTALTELQEAVRRAPDHAPSRVAHTEALSRAGYQERARCEAEVAVRVSAGLPRQRRLAVEALAAETRHDWDEAERIYRGLLLFFPDELEHGLRLTDVQIRAGRSKEALKTLENLGRRNVAGAPAAHLRLMEARAAGAMSDFHRQRSAALRALGIASALGSATLKARALLEVGSAHEKLGEHERAIELLSEAEACCQEMGDPQAVAQAVMKRAACRRWIGDFETAERELDHALALAKSLGDPGSIAGALNRRGMIRYLVGQLDDSVRDFRAAQQIWHEIGDPQQEANAVNNVGLTFWLKGKVSEAERWLSEAQELYRTTGSEWGRARTIFSLSVMEYLKGAPAAARDGARRALEIFDKLGDRNSCRLMLINLGIVELSMGRIEPADRYLRLAEKATRHPDTTLAWICIHQAWLRLIQNRISEARQLSAKVLELSDKISIGHRSRVELTSLRVDLALEDGDIEQARRVLRELRARDRVPKCPQGLGDLWLAWTRVEVAAGHYEKAVAASRKALEHYRKFSDVSLVLEATLVSIEARAGLRLDRQLLDEACETYRRLRELGFGRPELEALYLVGSLELELNPERGRRRLTALQKKATSRGFLLLAEKACRLLEAGP